MANQAVLVQHDSEPNTKEDLEDNSSVVGDFTPPDRSSSAPPQLGLCQESLFAFNIHQAPRYTNIFTMDLRTLPDYAAFYASKENDIESLPPPLEKGFFFDFGDYEEGYGSKRLERYYENQNGQHQEDTQQLPVNGNLTGNLSIPPVRRRAQSANVWSPTPTKPTPPESFNHEEPPPLQLQPDQRESLLASENTYSSSPSARIALNTTHFLFQDEQASSYGQAQPNYALKIANLPNGHSAANGESLNVFGDRVDAYFGYGDRSARNHEPVASNGQANGNTNESEALVSPRSNVICRYYAAGYCSRGEKCYYSHDVSPSEAQDASKKDGKTNRSPSKAKGNSRKQPPTPRAAPSVHAEPPIVPVPPSPTTVSPPNNGLGTLPQGEQMYTNFDQLIGKIYLVSKDQQGCRFLQKKLEEQDARSVEIIFHEVFEYITELMTDPFGNYLCQKLLEHCNDQQRYLIVERVAPDLVSISKNMHGTRAVQKMVECLSSPAQVQLVIKALSNSVVELIQDLNGNHVIQRCLNRLSHEDHNQFIYDAVTSGNNCVQVATHRHGCCVLQRCIDHASEKQKMQLIREITNNALILVQDPYGNYVVQYVLEMPFPNLVESLARSFQGHIRQLATQKFSSNVVEKCLAVAPPATRLMMITEILQENNLIAMLQDPFANYVVQTALTVSDPEQHHQLVDCIRPHLNQLRNTPYGKRIQSKITKESSEKGGKRDQKHQMNY